jgi:hypothetical protein
MSPSFAVLSVGYCSAVFFTPRNLPRHGGSIHPVVAASDYWMTAP